MPKTPENLDELEVATASLLLELAFLLPRGTDIREHSVGKALTRFTEAVVMYNKPTPTWKGPALPVQSQVEIQRFHKGDRSDAY